MSTRNLVRGDDELAAARARASHLEAELSAANHETRRLRGELAAWERRGQEVAEKWRKRNQQLAIELQAAQVGITSGCGCPIGECQQRGADQGSCWMQWAEAHVLARMANMRIGDLQRHGNHPSRFRAAAQEGRRAPRLASPDPIETDAKQIVREPGIQDYGSGTSTTHREPEPDSGGASS